MTVGSGDWFGVTSGDFRSPDEVAVRRSRAGPRPDARTPAIFFAAPRFARRTEPSSGSALVGCSRFTGKRSITAKLWFRSTSPDKPPRDAITSTRRQKRATTSEDAAHRRSLPSPTIRISLGVRMLIFAERYR
jgi:hypothetical protein